MAKHKKPGRPKGSGKKCKCVIRKGKCAKRKR